MSNCLSLCKYSPWCSRNNEITQWHIVQAVSPAKGPMTVLFLGSKYGLTWPSRASVSIHAVLSPPEGLLPHCPALSPRWEDPSVPFTQCSTGIWEEFECTKATSEERKQLLIQKQRMQTAHRIQETATVEPHPCSVRLGCSLSVDEKASTTNKATSELKRN